MKQLSRHYAYVLPGLPIAVFSFGLLLGLTVTSVATLIIWVGALLLPMTLVVASGFAELDRNRLRHWGAAVAAVDYRPLGPGVAGKLRLVLDPRRWLDLVFEMLIALPLRLITFTVTAVWSLAGPAGLTYFVWSLFIPDDGPVIMLMEATNPQIIPESGTAQYLLDAGVYFMAGLLFLITLPVVLRALASFDAMLTTALLGAEGRGEFFGHSTAETGHISRHQASFSARAWSWIGAGFVAVVMLAIGWPITAALYSVNVALAMVLVLVHCGAIILTLRWVWPGLGLSLLASAGIMAATAEAELAVWPWPVTAMVTQIAVLVVAALTKPWYCAASGWCAGAVLTLAALLITAPGLPEGALGTGIVFTSVSAGLVVVGILIRLWILNAGRLEAAERSSAQQDRRRKELEDRNRIARELHDVVAHSMSVISVQASTAQYRLPELGEKAQQEFEEIAASSRQALSEMRALLGILRGDDAAPTAPVPTLTDIEDLVESTLASGAQIEYHHNTDDDAEVSATVGLTTYRLVQEALSNALRHAPGAAISVRTTLQDELLKVEVHNTAPRSQAAPSPGSGLGLEGIRDRVASLRGTVRARATAEGGFEVQAELPRAE